MLSQCEYFFFETLQKPCLAFVMEFGSQFFMKSGKIDKNIRILLFDSFRKENVLIQYQSINYFYYSFPLQINISLPHFAWVSGVSLIVVNLSSFGIHNTNHQVPWKCRTFYSPIIKTDEILFHFNDAIFIKIFVDISQLFCIIKANIQHEYMNYMV